MKIDAIDPDDAGTNAVPSAFDVFAALARPRRANAVRYLAHRAGAVPLRDLAEYLAICEGTSTQDHCERVLVDLYHNHVPHLVDGGLVRYGDERRTVELVVGYETLAPYLELIPADGGR